MYELIFPIPYRKITHPRNRLDDEKEMKSWVGIIIIT